MAPRRPPPLDGSSGPETQVHRGTATISASPLLCTAYVSATSQYTPVAPLFLSGKRTFSFSKGAPDGWESPRFQAVYVAWSWFRQSGVVASHPPAGNTSRWAQASHRINRF